MPAYTIDRKQWLIPIGNSFFLTNYFYQYER